MYHFLNSMVYFSPGVIFLHSVLQLPTKQNKLKNITYMKFNIFLGKEFAFPVIFARIFIDTHFEFGLKNKSAGRLFWHFSFLEFMGGYKRNYVQVSTWMILNSTFRSNYKAIFLAAKNWSNSTDHLHYSTTQRWILVKSCSVKKDN